MPTKSTVPTTESAAAKPTAPDVREAQPLTEKFPIDFYQANGILLCPNGDKVRSDEQGLFCLVNGQRVPFAPS